MTQIYTKKNIYGIKYVECGVKYHQQAVTNCVYAFIEIILKQWIEWHYTDKHKGGESLRIKKKYARVVVITNLSFISIMSVRRTWNDGKLYASKVQQLLNYTIFVALCITINNLYIECYGRPACGYNQQSQNYKIEK